MEIVLKKKTVSNFLSILSFIYYFFYKNDKLSFNFIIEIIFSVFYHILE